MNLTGKKLTLVSITRQSIFDASYIGCCDNCGKVIVNIATVKDEAGKTFEIGLDCKKTLIDKPIIDSLLLGDFTDKYKAKEYKSKLNEVEKFLKFCSYPDIDITIDNSDVMIYDRLPSSTFGPDITGNIIYMQSTRYLASLGLTDFLNNLYKKLHNLQTA